jgi:hypothetical protein
MHRGFVLAAPVLILLALPVAWRGAAQMDEPTTAVGEPIPLVQTFATAVVVEGRSYPLKMVKVRLNSIRVKVGLAEGRVGHTESLAGIAHRYAAVAAINGSFFDAYTDNPTKNPDNTLITNGAVVHKGNIGSLIGFTADNQARIGRLPLKIQGGLDGDFAYPNNWYAYWINRFPEHANAVTIFTPYWGRSTGLRDGIQVVVSRGAITGIGRGPQAIPQDGYVIYFRGSEVRLAERFRVGRRCAHRIVPEDGRDMSFWTRVQEAVGGGPRLLTDGRVTADPVAEGFHDPKIVSRSSTRSMVGLTSDGWLILATSSGTVRQMAALMKALGASQAMNLDSGASSGLWLRGRYLSPPGRPISNALLVQERR